MENVGPSFQLDKYLSARQRTIEIVNQVSKEVWVGMSEEEGKQLVDKHLMKSGCERKWHPTKFRIGKNSLKAFREPSEFDVRLTADDIYFIDIGPVFEGQEADFGRSFSVGENQVHQDLISGVESVFHQTAQAWKNEKLTGRQLYERSTQIASELGYILNLKMAGHRLGDFPHALHFKGSLESIDKIPAENLWVLEILIRHPEVPVGAFFEDILI